MSHDVFVGIVAGVAYAGMGVWGHYLLHKSAGLKVNARAAVLCMLFGPLTLFMGLRMRR